MRILVVDNDATICRLIGQVLRDADYEVTEAVSGDEALVAFRTQPYPIVITDIYMQGINGIQLLRKIKQLRPATKVIMITGHASVEATMTAFQHGAFSYLTKPFDDVSLITAAVQQAVDNIKSFGLRILVADDEPSVRGLIAEVLEDEGHRVTQADSGDSALREFREYPYPLVITDIRMPGMDGLELLEAVKRLNANTQVVLMTSYASLETAVTAMRTGAFDYLVKPFEDLAAITTITNRAIDRIQHLEHEQRQMSELRHNKQQLEASNAVLKEQAVRDDLTGLYNRRFFQESLAAEINRATRSKQPFTLLFIDVDHFKQYNDRYGHPEGDKLLRELADILNSRTRDSDLVVRYGGEEFIMLLSATAAEGAQHVAEVVRRSVEEHSFHGKGNGDGRVTVSIGIASFPENGWDAVTLLEQADKALYAAKNSGRNSVSRIAAA